MQTNSLGRQPIFVIPRAKAIAIIQQWIDRKPFYYWGTEPELVIQQIQALPDHGIQDHVSLEKIGTIFQEAKTLKMPGHANAGMQFLQQEMRKHRVAT